MYSDILRATGHYQDHEAALFEKQVKVRYVLKDEQLLAKGEVARSVYYILEGAVQQYDTDDDLELHIHDLHTAGDWALNYESLITQRPAQVFISAFENTRLLELNLETVHYLTQKSIAFLQLNKVLEGALARLRFFDRDMTPSEKYQHILTHRPKMIQVFPLKMIASYLKVTPETLSRVRKALSRNHFS